MGKLELNKEQLYLIRNALVEQGAKTWEFSLKSNNKCVSKYFMDKHDRIVEIIDLISEQLNGK